MRYYTAMETKIKAALNPQQLEITDNSHKHAGHAGAHVDGESHFAIYVVSSAFEGKSLVQRQRMVYAAVAEELVEHVHALELKTQTPSEA